MTLQGDLLLNTKAPYPINDGSIILTLRPLDAEWGFISLNKLTTLTIQPNKFVSETTPSVSQNQEEKFVKHDNHIP